MLLEMIAEALPGRREARRAKHLDRLVAFILLVLLIAASRHA
jgi:hypothetical protein